MPCTNCMAEYTRRRKEIGCAVCRFGFCERCVSQKCAVPSVSPTKPVPVCNNCYTLLTDPKRQCPQASRLGAEKSRDLPPIGVPFEQNAWGTDRLPPPSLRSLYGTANAGKSGGGGGTKASEWGDLEARLARLNDPAQFGEPEPTMPTTSDKAQQKDGTKVGGRLAPAAPPPIEELEERLAALRGVPVEMVRKPRLMVINDSDDENSGDVPLSDEAAQLLRQVELGYAQNSATNYDRSSQKQQTMADDQCSLDSECPSSVLQNVISDALRAPSPSNLSNRTVSDGGQLYPNFAECVRKTVEDAQAAEREAMEFIRKYEQQNGGGGEGQQQSTKSDQRGMTAGHSPIGGDQRGSRTK
ncbi:hypothetical protein niasHS_006471 [Heterodera schachtii]|uniref:FYVE-type domain-containing protein n=1 Tax=Heterodera schachtii TaxID=97005 RepID=A0ABD2JHB9_HETSC